MNNKIKHIYIILIPFAIYIIANSINSITSVKTGSNFFDICAIVFSSLSILCFIVVGILYYKKSNIITKNK